ncbi:hypothetical protein ACN2XU_16350 [Primorskyibacter sp. 2E107]|uniref:hypothetical protein n=1 Tax=Primorskyibacter sp. 2E107 TaxID=3403458 RepID=UPI003AF4F231
MRYIFLTVFLLTSACAMGGPGFRGVEAIKTEYGGSKFTLRIRDNLVEATRTNPEMLPRFETVARKAGIAAQIQTGCRAAWVEGDPTMMLIGLSCNGETPPKKPKRRHMLYCDIDALQGRDGVYSGSLECGKF